MCDDRGKSRALLFQCPSLSLIANRSATVVIAPRNGKETASQLCRQLHSHRCDVGLIRLQNAFVSKLFSQRFSPASDVLRMRGYPAKINRGTATQ